jgi:LysR family glycine cleavage system transcriptional activator
MRKIPNFVLLRAFEAAARLQSFTLAAGELCLTPSAISHQVKELEGYFGRPLFVRRNRRVELTSQGQRLQDSLGRVFDVIEAACQEVALAPDAQVLALYCPPSFAVKWLGPRLPDFMKRFPDITLRLTSGAEPLDLTRMQEVDVAISYASQVQRPGLVSVALGDEAIVPLCAPALVDPHRPARDVIQELVLIDSQLSSVSWADWFRRNGLQLSARPRPSFDRAALAIAAAAAGVGVALESARLAGPEIARGELQILGADTFKPLAQPVHFLSYRASDKQLRKVRLFADWLLQSMDEPAD